MCGLLDCGVPVRYGRGRARHDVVERYIKVCRYRKTGSRAASNLKFHREIESALLHLQIHSLQIYRPPGALIDAMVYQKNSGRKKQAFYLLLEEGWKVERVALASGVSMQSIERWEVNYAVHGCVKPFKPTRGRPRLLTGDMINDIQRLLREDPVFLTRLRNGLLSTMTSPS